MLPNAGGCGGVKGQEESDVADTYGLCADVVARLTEKRTSALVCGPSCVFVHACACGCGACECISQDLLTLPQGLRRLTSLVQHELEKKVACVIVRFMPAHCSRPMQVVETQDVTGSSWGPGNTSPNGSSNEAALVSV